MSRHRPFVAVWVFSAKTVDFGLSWSGQRPVTYVFSALTGNNHYIPNNPSHPNNYNAVVVKLCCVLLRLALNNMQKNIGCDVHEISIPASRCSVEVHHTLPSARYSVPLHFACVRGLLQHEISNTTYFFFTVSTTTA